MSTTVRLDDDVVSDQYGMARTEDRLRRWSSFFLYLEALLSPH